MSSLRQRLARTVRALRENAGFSQEGFAAVIQVHRTYMGKLERGETDPGLEVLVRVAKGLRTTLSDLIRHAESEGGPEIGPSTPHDAEEWGRDPARRQFNRMVAENRKPPRKKK